MIKKPCVLEAMGVLLSRTYRRYILKYLHKKIEWNKIELSIQFKKFENDNKINKKKMHRRVNEDTRIN